MRHLSPADIRQRIEIQLTCMKGPARRAGGWGTEIAVREAANLIMTRVLAGCVIVAPDMVAQKHPEGHTWGEAPGEFGVTEDWPFDEPTKSP